MMPTRAKSNGVAVSTESGAYLLTADGGARKWRKLGPLLKGENVNSMAFDSKKGRLYAATHTEGVFVSDDLGKKWRPANKGLHVRKVWTVEIDPRKPSTLYAGTQHGHLFKSENGGESWEEVGGLFEAPSRKEWGVDWGFGTTGLCIHTIRVDPRNSKRIFIVASGNGPYRSDDGGATWRRLLDGVTDYCPLGGEENAPSVPKPDRDSKTEEHLKQVHVCTHKLWISKADPQIAFQQNHCGVYMSRDAGDHWVDVSPGNTARHGFPMVVVENGRRRAFTVPAYQGPESGGCTKHNSCIRGQLMVLRTDNDGKSWKKLTTGLPKGVHTCVLRDAMASGPRGVYFGTTTGEVYGSEDGGDSWHKMLEGVGRIQGVSSFAISRPS
jgi:photosystem II stability/assembly factor-like uncharacterized protein